MKKTVVIGFIGTNLDASKKDSSRWAKWRPSVGLAMQEDLRVDRFELVYSSNHEQLSYYVAEDISRVSPETAVNLRQMNLDNPWDFEEVYGKLLDFCQAYEFNPDEEDYLIHITTGTHVAQICMFLLTEARYFPAKLLQTQPVVNSRNRSDKKALGKWNSIDLDLSRYDSIASRFAVEAKQGSSFLKSGIETRNKAFNAMIDEIEQVAVRSKAPILLTGPTGAGKSQLAKRIYELKNIRHKITGPFAEVNCATLRGDSAMSALFGHKKGAFTGAAADRAGLLKKADKGVLFLDEIGELGLDEQAMILRAVEEKCFTPMGSDSEISSDFQLIAGTNKNLHDAVAKGTFRDDLLARLNIWTFEMPGLAERREDIAPNIDYELDRFAEREGERIGFNSEARRSYLGFAISSSAQWKGNFRDLSASITRMATLSPKGRIGIDIVQAEINRLSRLWDGPETRNTILDGLLPAEKLDDMDLFDRLQLEQIIPLCQSSKSLSEAGRKLFAMSRQQKSSSNDADRLKKFLERFDLSWKDLKRS